MTTITLATPDYFFGLGLIALTFLLLNYADVDKRMFAIVPIRGINAFALIPR